MSAQWKRLPTGNEPPPARAYHSMTCIDSRYLLFGGFDGKSTFGELWWLVSEGTDFALNQFTHRVTWLLFVNPFAFQSFTGMCSKSSTV